MSVTRTIFYEGRCDRIEEFSNVLLLGKKEYLEI